MVLLFASCGLLSFLLFCFEFCFFCLVLSKKTPKKLDTAKTPKTKMQKKDKQKNQLAQLCSQIVFLIYGCGLQKCYYLLKTYSSRGLSIFWESQKGPKMWKRLSWKSVQGWVENLSNYVAQHNWTDFQLNKKCFSLFLSFNFYKIAFSLQKEDYFWKIKKNKEDILDIFSTQKRAIFGQIFNSTT